MPHHAVHTLKERALHPLRQFGYERLQALNEVTFDVEPGEFFGIVGRNGSGKSTLLKCLAGIYRPDGGRVVINGRLSPFIELGVGFNPDLTARDNVLVNATLLGLSTKEALRRFDDIIAFAELEDFLDLKFKNYSSGMQVRLGFATAIQVDADILLVDEVLAVGDANFQVKCFDIFRELKRQGRTIVFVTHDMGAVQRFCDRALYLESGKVIDTAKPRTIIREYSESNYEKQRQAEQFESQQTEQLEASPGEERWGTQAAKIIDVWLADSSGERQAAVPYDEELNLCMKVTFNREMPHPIMSLAVSADDDNRTNLFGVDTTSEHIETPIARAGDEITVSLKFHNLFVEGRYFVSAAVHDQDGKYAADQRLFVKSFLVRGGSDYGMALVDLPHVLTISPIRAG